MIMFLNHLYSYIKTAKKDREEGKVVKALFKCQSGVFLY